MLKSAPKQEIPISRSQRREVKHADDFLKGLVNTYIAFKNKHIKEERGYILLDPVVMIFFDELNSDWKTFCHGYKTNAARNYQFDISLFRKNVDNHLAVHRRLCWVNYAMECCIKEKLFPTVKMVQSCYDDGNTEPEEIIPVIEEQLIHLIMHTLEIPDLKYSEKFASEISELTSREFLYFIDLLRQWKNNEISLEDFKTMFVLKLLNIKYSAKYERLSRISRRSDEIRQTKQIIDSNIHLLAQEIESFFIDNKDENGVVYRDLNLYFIKNLLPFIKIPFLKIFRRKLYGPADALSNSTWFEYRKAHGYFVNYIENKNEDDLHRLVAVLYRPRKSFLWLRKLLPGYSGDLRREISSKMNSLYLERRARKIAKAKSNYVHGVLLFFKNCEEFLRYGKPRIGQSEIDLSIIYQSSPDYVSTGPDIGLVGILYSLAESGVFGSIENVDNQNLFDILARLYQVVKEANDIRESSKRKK